MRYPILTDLCVRGRNRRKQAQTRLSIEMLEDRSLPSTSLTASLVADINPGPASSAPGALTDVNGTLLFSAIAAGTTTPSLYKSDGTAAGTVLVKAGAGGTGFTAVGATVFYSRGWVDSTGETHGELWKTDGTAAGTVLVKKGVLVGERLAVGGKLFFNGDDGKNGRELWVSNGTSSGTRMVKDLYPGMVTQQFPGGGTVPAGSHPSELNNLGGKLLFRAQTESSGAELWQSDGTSKGTLLVKDILPGAGSSWPHDLTLMNGLVYFGADGGLWKTDGTTAGTVLVAAAVGAYHLTNVDGTLFFTRWSSYPIGGLWKSDGTLGGTVLVKDLQGELVQQAIGANGRFYFTVGTGATPGEIQLWTSDGTAAGTVILQDTYASDLANVNGRVYFAGDDGVHGRELWQTDGTRAGTVMVRDIYPGVNAEGKPNSSFPDSLTAMNNKLYFSADDGVHGRELWDPPPVEAPTSTATVSIIPGEFLVSFRPGVDQAEIGRFYAEHGLSEMEALDRYARADAARLKLVSVPAARTEGMISILERDPRIAYAEPNYLITGVLQAATPTDPFYVQQDDYDNVGQWGGTLDADMDTPEAWKITTGSPDVLVAVVDSGIDYRHPDLAANIWTNPFEIAGDGIDNDGDGYVDDIHGIDTINDSGEPLPDSFGDMAYHGTAVAGIIGATPFNEGSAGVAWRVGIIAVKAISGKDSIKTSDAVQAYQYINFLKHVQGQNIVAVNSSYKAGQFKNSQAVRDAMAGVDQPGMSPILQICSAGNDNTNTDFDPQYPSDFELDNIISVAATDRNDHYADFSNWGPTSVDLAAPGGFVASTATFDRIAYGFSGTSAAAPQVTGAAVLIASAFPSLSAAEIKVRILNGVDPIGHIGNNGQKPTLTNGRLNIPKALGGALPEIDNKSPTAVGNLSIDANTFQSITLSWTATGDDGVAGRAALYDVRYSTAAITKSTWDTATRALREPGPKSAASAETFTITGLDPATTYYFAMKVRDNMGNESALSNVASSATAAATVLFSDRMESGANGWTGSGLWHQSSLRAASASTSWYYGIDATRNYDTGTSNSGALTSPVIDLRNATHPVLIYREWRDVEESPALADNSEVQIGVKPTEWITAAMLDLSTAIVPVNWQQRAAVFGWSAPYDSEFGDAQWVSRAIDLSAYSGQTIRLRFTFNSGDAAFNTFEGWYVDDVSVFDTTLAALRASASVPSAGAPARSLKPPQVQQFLDEALARWQTAGADTASLGAIDLRIADLGGTMLGLAAGHTIWLDNNAAGWGWFVDPTPGDDSEFTTPGNQGEQRRMDLLNVLAHEIGHVLGHDHEEDGVMIDTLTAGIRRRPSSTTVVDWSAFLDALVSEPLSKRSR